MIWETLFGSYYRPSRTPDPMDREQTKVDHVSDSGTHGTHGAHSTHTLAMMCHQKVMVDDLRATIATLAGRHGLGLIITQGDTTMACGPRAEACLKFIMEEGEIRGLKYSGPATRPKDFMSFSPLKHVQDVELGLVYDMYEHSPRYDDTVKKICETVASLPCLSSVSLSVVDVGRSYRMENYTSFRPNLSFLGQVFAQAHCLLSLELDLYGARLSDQIPWIAENLVKGCDSLKSVHLCLGMNEMTHIEVHRLLEHLRSLYAKPGLSSVYLDLSSSFLDGQVDGPALRTLLTGLSVGSLTLDLSMNNNMLKGDGLLGGLSNLGPDTKFLGVTLRDNDLRCADINNLAVCLTGREWDVRVDTIHKPMYYNEHLDGDRALAKGFLQREGREGRDGVRAYRKTELVTGPTQHKLLSIV